MGTYYSTYVGCYLKLKPQIEAVKETFRVKPNGKRAKTKFNPETGVEYPSKTEVRNVKSYPKSFITDRDDLYEDAFTDVEAGENEVIFIPNGEDNLVEGDTQWNYQLSLRHIDVEHEIMQFKLRYSKYLDYYTEKFGEYEIDFGIIRRGR